MMLKSLLTTSSLDTSRPRSEAVLGCYGWVMPLGFNSPVLYIWLSDWDCPKAATSWQSSLVLPVSSHTTMFNGALKTW